MREVGRWLQLGHKGVIVMIRAAQLPRLRELARMLATFDAALKVTTAATDLLACEPGALVLLLVCREDLGWLNLNRPVVAQRSLRLVLWVDEDVGARIKFESPDFHDWISHFVKCPPGVPQFAVDGLRVGSTWWPGVTWTGLGLELALAELGIEVVGLDPDAAFDELVETLREDPQRAVRWTGVDSLRKLWRVRWAVAEARHHGFCVLDNPGVSAPGWFPVDARQLRVDDAAMALHGFDDDAPMRAIDVDLERPAIVRESAQEDDLLREVGLLLHAGPRLRRMHGSQDIARWRRELVRSIRRDPQTTWSRHELALFASLERDREQWPDLLEGQPKQRHYNEHLLRLLPSAGCRGLWIPAMEIYDLELVGRWGGPRDQLEPVDAKELWQPSQREQWLDSPAPQGVLDLGRKAGWDVPYVIRAAAIVAESLVEQPDQLHEFIAQTLNAAKADLGVDEPAFVILTWIANIALALAGQPWQARDELEAMLERGVVTPVPVLPAWAAIRAACGDYAQAAEVLHDAAKGDSPQTRLYIASLLSAGYAAKAESELARILGEQTDPRTYLGEPADPKTLARELLLARLRAF